MDKQSALCGIRFIMRDGERAAETERQDTMITFEADLAKMKSIEWRLLCELAPHEILTGLAMKTYEPTGGINSPAQVYGGIRLKIKNLETGETREIDESWRMFGKMAES